MKKVLTMKMNKKWVSGLFAATMFGVSQGVVFADDVQNSKLATGTQKLVTDLTTWLMILAPAVTVLCVIYFLIRRGMSDDMDHKKWNSRITVAIVSSIGAVLAAVIVNLIVGYYK